MTTPALSLDSLDKIYNPGSRDAVHAVKKLDMHIEAGEIIALLGSSGCGKTSTLRMIAGFESISHGSISIDGRMVHELAPAKRNVAMAFEGYSLYPPLTVRENIGFALKSQRVSAAEISQRVEEITSLLEIPDILDRYPSSISGGQQQRASLARALIRDAKIHLLDEPMGQLEPQLRALLRGRLKHFIKERGITAILVTHDQTEANALADRIAVMEDGELQQFASPDELRERPANLFTGTFIGEPPMNVLASVATNEGDELVFSIAEARQLRFPGSHYPAELRERLTRLGKVVIGVRPHAVRLADSGLGATVITNQWLGDQSHIAADFSGVPIVAVTHERSSLKNGDQLNISLAAEDLHIFDPQSGQVIAHGRESA